MKTSSILLALLLMLTSCGNKSNDTPQAMPAEDTTTETMEQTTTETVEQTTPKPFSSDDEEYTRALAEAPSDDDIIREGIKGFLLGKPDAAYLTDRAEADIAESSWPEVQCSVDGTLDSPRSFRNLKVKEVGPRKYKYECTCPKHGDKFVDYCTVEAYLERDGETVTIDEVTWDDDIPD